MSRLQVSASMRTSAICPICLEQMSKADLAHPTQCEKKCGYNFCLDCVEHLITSSESEVQEASDGHMAVKINLSCPQCRSDLSHSIRDTLLLRKVDVMKKVMKSSDDMLTAKELRLKHSFDSEKVHEALELAKRNEKAYLNNEKVTEHVNIHPDQPEELFIDQALFRGMHFAMTKDEQHFVTILLTSGNPFKLAQAAEILKGIGDMCRKGITPSMRQTQSSDSVIPPPPPPTRTPPSARHLRSGRSNTAGAGRVRPKIETTETKVEKAMKIFQKCHPLPRRMPWYAYIPTEDFIQPRARTYPIQFDQQTQSSLWNGCIATALNQKHPITVTQVRGSCGKYGIHGGDVITHINNEECGEEWSVDLLLTRILLSCSEQGGFSLVVNADDETAVKLKERAGLFKAAIAAQR